ncbi:large subunit ribosomal protein L21 [Mesorhizobium sp. J18]|uniref:50S ribosomal protein L21 n=1 Tax=Mesorhizobium sp. J18 TaxID=935263 RepID=UPI001199D8F4|nr:50S ribosomal protein L21 [Mesorhizobium sp. J18]TWG98984.1 large subunit ribosomal protein L21 [Mesorhizobium sp. J18]
MFAVIKTGGRQYRVTADDLLQVGRIAGEPGDIIELGQVLAVGEGADVTFGTPVVEGATVAAEVVEHGRGKKVIAFKKRRRQNSRRKRGYRDLLTTVRISEILVGGAKPSKKAAPKKAEAESKKASAKAEVAEGVNDDVSLISGVGPALKKKLEEAGITSLKQIAELKKADADKLDEDLSLGGRIERDEWVAQAKELLAGKPPRAKVDQAAAAEDK